jgi:hypothetical protein
MIDNNDKPVSGNSRRSEVQEQMDELSQSLEQWAGVQCTLLDRLSSVLREDCPSPKEAMDATKIDQLVSLAEMIREKRMRIDHHKEFLENALNRLEL